MSLRTNLMCMKTSAKRFTALLFSGLCLRLLRSRHLFGRRRCCVA